MKQSIAHELLEIGALHLRPENPFTWTSGIRSPIYCDNRLILSFPKTRDLVLKGFVDLIREKYPEVNKISGCATAGIPAATLIAHVLNLPMTYVRGEAKKHGRQNQIEGLANPGQKVVVIEDLLSTGKSSIACVKALREAGCEVLGIVAIFSYDLPILREQLKAAKVEATALSNYDTLIQVAISRGIVARETEEKLFAFRANPQDPAWMEI